MHSSRQVKVAQSGNVGYVTKGLPRFPPTSPPPRLLDGGVRECFYDATDPRDAPRRACFRHRGTRPVPSYDVMQADGEKVWGGEWKILIYLVSVPPLDPRITARIASALLVN